ncbi:MAG: TMEM175 family protein [Leucobacter sp.]
MRRRGFEREGAEFGRGLGFFDAIHGFAITLLVVNIEPPPAEAWSSPATLFAHGLGTNLMGFAISFVVIAMFWRHNTEILSRFSAIDQAVITSNLFSAALIVLLPFTTQGISEFSDYPLAVALYACNVALVILSQSITLEVGRRRGLLLKDPSPALIRAERLDTAVKIGIFLLSIAVAYLIDPNLGMASWLLLLVFGPLMGRRTARAMAAQAEDEGEIHEQNS